MIILHPELKIPINKEFTSSRTSYTDKKLFPRESSAYNFSTESLGSQTGFLNIVKRKLLILNLITGESFPESFTSFAISLLYKSSSKSIADSTIELSSITQHILLNFENFLLLLTENEDFESIQRNLIYQTKEKYIGTILY